MRHRVAFSFLILSLGGLILLLEATEGYAQRGGGGGKFKFGMPGGGDFKIDSGRIFGFLSKGRDHFEIKEAFRDRDVLELFAKQNNITDGKINQQQFAKYWEERDKLREEVRKDGGNQGGRGGRGGDPEAMFKRFDTNGDGFLNEDEIKQTRRFQDEWQKWDTNKDGRISLDEWKAYMAAQSQARGDSKDGDKKDDKKDGDKKDDKKDGDKKDEKKESITRIELEELENIPPVVYRAGNLPKELPDWFTELDLNKDGQVSLMEWMKGGKAMGDFAKWDRNDDDSITPEEALRYQRIIAGPAAGGDKVADASGGPDGKGPPPTFGSGGGFKDFGKGDFGKGKAGPWMKGKKGRKRGPQ